MLMYNAHVLFALLMLCLLCVCSMLAHVYIYIYAKMWYRDANKGFIVTKRY
jgi:hypothetical protein